MMNADGSNKRRLTHKGRYNTSPSWGPKGDMIAFVGRDKGGKFDIFTVSLQGNIERLTQNQGSNESPSFSPDGRYIIFTSDRSRRGRKRLWLMTADGQFQVPVTSKDAGSTSSPKWSR